MPEPERLWTVADLARYLRYAESTITSMVSRSPERLPPRAPTHMPRCNPETVRAWSMGPSPRPYPKRGRPRNVPS